MAKKPNILILWGDDIGQSNLSCFTRGMMGYTTPNIDRIASEGMLFTDYYAEQSCTAGRASFITGQGGLRTGLTKVGMPGAKEGMKDSIPTIATVLKAQGYATGQFGKNHLGDRDEQLPTMHGFDEFFGNLYHLNAEEEPENPDYPDAKEFPNFRKRFGPRGVLHCKADGKGGQSIEDTGPLTKKRMETIDDEVTERSVAFIREQVKAGVPFFVWFNTTHMHFRTHVKPESRGQAGRWQSEYHDVMIDHDKAIGVLLDLVDELGIADDTFVMYSTDNGPHCNSWPDAGTTPFRSEKNTSWEGAYRVPAMVRWPGKIPAGSVSNDIVSHLDWLPTFAEMAGAASIKEDLKKGATLNGKTFKSHLDGDSLVGHLTKGEKSPRKGFIYFTDEGEVAGLRMDNWKVVFMEQKAEGTLEIWGRPFVTGRIPKLFNLRTDPYEFADITSNTYWDWYLDRAFILVPCQDIIGEYLETLKAFPPAQRAGSFNLEKVMDTLQFGATGGS
ncbi:arylsulfatase [Phenylobacterium sp. Root77]|jgi:arylsulfatase A-like enzyme|uniref:arylsulfatase n=1 Tax=unclassified Phenylobacterium TaxID=2640670 RepID=UPI000700CBC4|nr:MULTISPECIES: arylsulfatase [unclassified Phenylobacterium]KQW66501.1 arylsulfatase [Phenylobacterium sp. Root1277]KQW89007.1 arylsulfatase [Phenylobacterium sp. Root1290]KRC42137.1 arylsulfatase [Phenylobacterium sp. Root77]